MALLTSMALKATQGGAPLKYLGVINDGTQNQDYLEFSTDEVLNQNAKFSVEYAYDDLVHIRSCSNNKYWVRSSSDGYWIVAQGVKPVVDKTSWKCTLFRMEIDDDNKKAKFYHVQSGHTIRIPDDGSARKMFLTIDPVNATEATPVAVDYDTLVVLPKFVAFKGTNGLYYKNYSSGSKVYSVFSVSDIGDPNIVCEIQNTSDGSIKVRATNALREKPVFWACGILTDAAELVDYAYGNPPNLDQIMFNVIKIDENKVALRSLWNNKFCMKSKFDETAESKTRKDCLVAGADGLVHDSYLEVVEPVFRRTVTVYEFHIHKARIYNVKLLSSHEHIWDNYTDQTQSGSANVTISTTKTRTYSNSITVSGNVKTTFGTGIPFIAKGEIEISASGSYTCTWGQTEEETQQVGHTIEVNQKARETTIVKGVATKGSCDVPFSYVQKDYPADGGPPRITKLEDGVFTGANAYSFRDEVRYEALPTYTGPPDQAPSECIKRPIVMMGKREKTILKFSSFKPKSRPLLAPLSFRSSLVRTNVMIPSINLFSNFCPL